VRRRGREVELSKEPLMRMSGSPETLRRETNPYTVFGKAKKTNAAKVNGGFYFVLKTKCLLWRGTKPTSRSGAFPTPPPPVVTKTNPGTKRLCHIIAQTPRRSGTSVTAVKRVYRVKSKGRSSKKGPHRKKKEITASGVTIMQSTLPSGRGGGRLTPQQEKELSLSVGSPRSI